MNLYEAHGREGRGATAWVAGGMISPQAEAADAAPKIISMGYRSHRLWRTWLAELGKTVHFCEDGTIVVWHRSDAGEAKRFETLLKNRDAAEVDLRVDAKMVSQIEPALAGRFNEALFLPEEAHIDNRQLLPALADALEELGVKCYWERKVPDEEHPDADLVIDCRGKQARQRWKELRWVRGEIVRLHAPGLQLKPMIRLLHPRHPVYIISRPDGNVVVGATSVESDDCTPVSVRGALELLSSAYAVLPQLGEARILELNTDCRPALPDNCPRIRYDATRRLMEVNGLYRHGFLLSPAIIEEVLSLLPQLLLNSHSELIASSPWLELVEQGSVPHVH